MAVDVAERFLETHLCVDLFGDGREEPRQEGDKATGDPRDSKGKKEKKVKARRSRI